VIARARRRVGRLRRRLRKPEYLRPPYGSAENVESLSRTPVDEDFITGNGIAARCRYVLNYDELRVNEGADNNWWFCKADYLEYFFAKLAPADPFVLFSHNSDRSIGSSFARELRRRSLRAWLAQNPSFEHPKLRALPIGIANPAWPHGDQDELRRVQEAPPPRTRLFDASFSLDTNVAARTYCVEQTEITPTPSQPFPGYLRQLASSYFCIAPAGNGIDTHRVWEALYLRTVPVVTRSLVTDHHADLPLVVLDDWAQFKSVEFSEQLYERVIGDWSPIALRLDHYLDRVRELAQMAPAH
jgi:hypothetical protein